MMTIVESRASKDDQAPIALETHETSLRYAAADEKIEIAAFRCLQHGSAVQRCIPAFGYLWRFYSREASFDFAVVNE